MAKVQGRCKYGDPYCPCQDGDACHYKGENPMPAPKLKVSEADIQRTVVEFLQLDGWRAIRTDPVSDRSRGKGFGEIGMPDYLFIRYLKLGSQQGIMLRSGKSGLVDLTNHLPFIGHDGCAEVMYIEFKAPGKKPRPEQLLWHHSEAASGALVKVVDNINVFIGWYESSGLQRRRL